MKKKELKLLEEKLAGAVKKILVQNNATLTEKIEKKLKKLVAKIVKKSKPVVVIKQKTVKAKQ